MKRDRFETLARNYAKAIQDSKKAKNSDRIFLPGEIEAENEAGARSQGVEVDDQLVVQINQLLEKKGLAAQITRCSS